MKQMNVPVRTMLLVFALISISVKSTDCAEPMSELSEGRPPKNVEELQYWLANMVAHNFTAEEVGLALDVPTSEAAAALLKYRSSDATNAEVLGKPKASELFFLPYPGGRHPRIGFLEGAVHPQRETKVSVFAPWKDGGYLVVDLPEAVWHHVGGKRELLYLAHTHIPTIWDKQGVRLPVLEWNREQDHSLNLTREFPNKVKITSRVKAADGGARLEFRVSNNSETPLTGLHIQMCGMLKGLSGFARQTNDNKVFSVPFAACRSDTGNRWVVFGFDRCIRAWGNAQCPCLHADPQIPDCAPGETQTVHGWVSFFDGEEIQSELKRLERIAFQPIGHN